jgi:hypothetical protein
VPIAKLSPARIAYVPGSKCKAAKIQILYVKEKDA